MHSRAKCIQERGAGATGSFSHQTASVTRPLTAARNLAPAGVRVMTIAPGIFFTPAYMVPREKVEERWDSAVPNPRRMGETDEYARLAQHIVENDYLNGTTIRIDGALRFNI
jgi:NAD(P)-dependent dehydrogenase (short-subunit alcohol dehydrogenase family)